MALCVLAGCASPLEQVPRLADVDVADAPVAEIAAAEADDRTLFERVFGRGEAGDAGDVGAAAEAEPVEAAAAAPVGGVLSRLFGRGAAAEGEAGGAAEGGAASEGKVEGGAASPRDGGEEPGLLAQLFGRRADAGAVTLDPAEFLPASAGAPEEVGPVARVCGVERRALGTEVGASGGFRLYDTIPGATVARAHHITGFSDGCARRFSAALAFIGDPAKHEVVRYDRMNRGVRWTAVDDAYERLKSRLCRVPERRPCGAQMGRMARVTAIVSAYPTFGTNRQWTELLLHRRKLVAVAEKSRQ